MSLAHRGRVLLNTRINFHDGHPPAATEESYWHGSDPAWHVVRHQPKGKVWAISTHASAKMHHQIKYQLVATHKKTGLVVKVTVWKCSRRCSSEILVERVPVLRKRCWHCSKF